MCVRIISGPDGVCFYDTVTYKSFGMKMENEEEAKSFLDWVNRDVRTLTPKDLDIKLEEFRRSKETFCDKCFKFPKNSLWIGKLQVCSNCFDDEVEVWDNIPLECKVK